MLSLATAYWMLRPFFRARDPASPSLKWEDWNELDLNGTGFAGCGHCDMIHAVEGHHGGKEDSSVLYIPAVPLTLGNAQYLRDQRTNFLAGLPAPCVYLFRILNCPYDLLVRDFPGGSGESTFVGRATVEDVYPGGRCAVGFEKFNETAGDGSKLFAEANRILAF
ncbi:hypothetical protein MVEN_00439100 [Mycena venus]|uniref:Uncharacterized protein n=1 Tax=Mycena venus TaxID=2733690 RepID=A0A8H6YR13_9AGAR|nr:hypothetical protein MVEN_00439100 [Mycena venus]